MEVHSKIFSIISNKISLPVSIFCALLLFSPLSLKTKIGLDSFITSNKDIIWIVFLFSSVLYLYEKTKTLSSYLGFKIRKIRFSHVTIKRINQLLRACEKIQNTNTKIKTASELIEKETDTNSMDFILGNKGLYYNVNIYHIDKNQTIIIEFFDLLNQAIVILEDVIKTYPALKKYIDQIESISIDNYFEKEQDIDKYFNQQVFILINSLKSIKQIVSNAHNIAINLKKTPMMKYRFSIKSISSTLYSRSA